MEELIEAIARYVPLNNKDISIIERLFEKRELKKDGFFLQPDSVCRNFAFVSKGLLRHYIRDNGEEKNIYFSAEKDFVCDYESFINRRPSQKGIIAAEDTALFSASYKGVQAFYKEVSTGERFGRLLLEEVFTEAVNQIISSHTDSAEERYLHFLSSFEHIRERIPQYHIASFVG